MDVVAVLRALDYGARVARIERCPVRVGGRLLWCRDRQCGNCRKRWLAEQLWILLDRLRGVEGAVMVMATLGRAGTSPRSAAANLRRPAERFGRIARRHRWIRLGAKHLTRSAEGAWWWHHHLLVVASGTTRSALAAAVRGTGAWVDDTPVRDCMDVLAYALWGAITPKVDAADLAQWIRGTARLHLAISSRARDTNKRRISTATPTATPADRARASILRQLGNGVPRSASDLWAGLTSALRAALRGPPAPLLPVLTTMEQAGELRRVAGRRGVRWALAEREAA